MSIKNNIYKEASDIIAQRRIDAEQNLQLRQSKAEHCCPEIATINAQLAQTGIKLFDLLTKGEDIANQIKKLEKENTQAQLMLKSILKESGFSPDYLDIKHTCEICGDTGYVNSKRCKCFYDLVSQLSAQYLNSATAMKLTDFDSFNLDYYKGCKGDNGEDAYIIMCKIFEFCKNFAENFTPSSNGIFMLGKTGLGKTHLSLAIANKVISKGYSVAYDSIINFLMQVEREHFGKSDTDTLSMLLDVELLILDDLGAEYEKNSFYASTIYNIINTRLNKGLCTIISTNLSKEQFNARYDDRIVSRLFAVFDYLRFYGEDIRYKKKYESTYKKTY